MDLIDSHAHLTDEQFAGDVDAVIARAGEAGVFRIITVATNPDDARAAIALAERYPQIYATAGVHPHAAGSVAPPAEMLDELRRLAAHPRVVAIGEAGLDFHYDFSPRDRQIEWFRSQLELAVELRLPIVVHARNADDDVATLFREAGPECRGVLHCFSSGPGLLETALELGWMISFAGMVTFNRYEDEELVRAVPLDRLMVETDSPYLAPVPHRGKRNEPAFVIPTALRLAELRGEDPAELARATTANARAFFGLSA